MSADRGTPSYVELVHTMGTVVTIDVRVPGVSPGLEAAVAEAADRLQRVDEDFSTWIAGSWVSRLLSGAVPREDCPAHVRDVLALAERLDACTDGWFSPGWSGTSGPDPTGLVKGWAAQRASDVLLAHGFDHHVVNAAGDLVVSGSPFGLPGGPAWRIGIADPRVPGHFAGVVELAPVAGRWAVATSGTAELGRHVVDPRTGECPGSVGSATVVVGTDVHPEAGAVADACATALVAAGERSPALVERLGRSGVASFVLHADGRVSDPDGRLVPLG